MENYSQKFTESIAHTVELNCFPIILCFQSINADDVRQSCIEWTLRTVIGNSELTHSQKKTT